MANLVIVESPAKAGTIKNYLGSGYRVVASKGHVRDLPKSTLGVDVDDSFRAKYINIRGKGPLIAELKKEAKAADKIFLATDPDREGEAISWHLAAALALPPERTRRVTFNEITKSAIKDAIKHPRDIDTELVNSQQARRILDRIVGYKLSPFLWKAVRGGLSAGRVQSVATRIIVEREEEIRAFNPVEYWTIEVPLKTDRGGALRVKFTGGADGRKIELPSREAVDKVLGAITGRPYTLRSLKTASRARHPAPPFTTSTLQQEAARKLGFQSVRIMRVAQELYEGVSLGTENGGTQGLITYMRTDSLRVSAEAQEAAKDYIVSSYGEELYPASPRVYKSKSNAQDAHEAIRPSKISLEPEKIKKHLTTDQYRLYKLIWTRFVASQMTDAEIETVTADFECNSYAFRATASAIKKQGYLSVYEDAEEGTAGADEEKLPRKLPRLTEGEQLEGGDPEPAQHFTEPPPRYTEASLVKFLEEKGIGRPSTYTPIITTIIARGYVEREGKALRPTSLGEVTTGLMKHYFPKIVDYAFTAQMEDELDGIEHGKSTMLDVLGGFYGDFARSLEAAESSVGKGEISVPDQETDIVCDKCGAKMVIKNGRFGRFAACPNYPNCRNTRPLGRDGKVVEKTPEAQKTDLKCEKCGRDMVLRTGRYGSFYACSGYPECKYTKQITKDIGVPCPKCGGKLVAKRGRNKAYFYACENYSADGKGCDYSTWDLPLAEKCPLCGNMLLRKKGKGLIFCSDKNCTYKREEPLKTEAES